MIKLRDVSVRRGTTLVFSEGNCSIAPGTRMGIVGRNGSGKSTLFELLEGNLHPDTGDVYVPPSYRIASVKQEMSSGGRVAIDFVIDGDTALQSVKTRLSREAADQDGLNFAKAYSEFDELGGHSIQARAGRLLSGLGFEEREHSQPVDNFSGGWRIRLALAQALIQKSDLLLLDEPTNHLDLETVWWLEKWLCTYAGTLLVISHDREFLDNVVGQVLHIRSGRIRTYRGNYSSFECQMSEEAKHQKRAYAKQQNQIKTIQTFVDRFRAKPKKARQAQSRLRALERMESVSLSHVDTPFNFNFTSIKSSAGFIVAANSLAVGYENSKILGDIRFTLGSGSRVGLLGVNGAGKSTLLKTLAGELPGLGGELNFSKEIRIGYFAQHQVEDLDDMTSALGLLRRETRKGTDQELRTFLGGFAFSGEKVHQKVGMMSGGEKARVALALLVWRQPNLLLLDEPTNHLDMDVRLALTLALQEYEGAVILISHDRHLLRTVTDELWVVAGDGLNSYLGDLDDYTRELEKPVEQRDISIPSSSRKRAERKKKLHKEAILRQKRRPYEKRARRLEKQVERLSEEREVLDALLAESSMYQSNCKDILRDTLFARARIDEQLEQLETQWVETIEAMEKLVCL